MILFFTQTQLKLTDPNKPWWTDAHYRCRLPGLDYQGGAYSGGLTNQTKVGSPIQGLFCLVFIKQHPKIKLYQARRAPARSAGFSRIKKIPYQAPPITTVITKNQTMTCCDNSPQYDNICKGQQMLWSISTHSMWCSLQKDNDRFIVTSPLHKFSSWLINTLELNLKLSTIQYYLSYSSILLFQLLCFSHGQRR